MSPVLFNSGAVVEAARSLHVGVLYISLTNLLIIVAMIVVFVLALVLPFPHRSPDPDGSGP